MLEKLGERIKAARKKKGLRQADLAQALGVSTATVGQYEVGSSNPSINMLLKISETCDVNTDWLLKGVSVSGIDYKNMSEEDSNVSNSLVLKLKKELEEKENQIRALSNALNLITDKLGKLNVTELPATVKGLINQLPIQLPVQQKRAEIAVLG